MGGGGGYKPINQSSHKLKKIMIIEKVFSNIEEESEKLYSILLSEDEVALFSEFQKEFNSKSQPKEKKETKLKFGDRLIIRGYKNRGQDYRDEPGDWEYPDGVSQTAVETRISKKYRRAIRRIRK